MREGQIIADRYRLQEVIGSGGQSVVWRAADEYSEDVVAVKEQHLDDKALRAAELLAGIRHPYLVRVLAWSAEYLVMEYVSGGTLADKLEGKRRLGADEVARIGAQIASALDAVHAAGLVHRDVKPGNIMIASDGTARLTDFGISHVAWADPTGAGLIGGTPAYVAPEVADGDPPTPASDVFSLGATLFAAVEGVPVYGYGTTSNTFKMLALARDRGISPPRRAGALRQVLSGMLRADPAGRPSAARAFELLARACPDEVALVPPVPRAAARRGLPWSRRARTATAGIGIAGVAGIALLLAVTLRSHQASHQHRPPVLAIGDPRTADPCALTDAAAFTRFGDAKLSTDYGNFNRCDVIVQSSGGSVVDVELQLEVPGWFDDPTLSSKPPPGGIKVIKKPPDGSACDRALILPDRNLVLISADQAGTGQARLCAMADAQTAIALTALHRSGVPRRAQPSRASLASRNACSLPDPKSLDAVPGIAGATRTQGFAGWECRWDSNSAGSYVKLGFDRGVPLDSSDGRPVRAGGLPMYLQPDGDGTNTCVIGFAYRQYTDVTGQPTQDQLQLTVGDAGSVRKMCGEVTRLAEVAAAHLGR